MELEANSTLNELVRSNLGGLVMVNIKWVINQSVHIVYG